MSGGPLTSSDGRDPNPGARFGHPLARRARGLGTIELAATVALIAVALVPLLAALSGSLDASSQNRLHELAADLAASRMARLHALPFGQITSFNGHRESPPRDPRGRLVPQAAGMSLDIGVVGVAPDRPAGAALPPGDAPMLRLTVRITWTGGRLELTSLHSRLLDPGA